jgi:hypothetical protein
LFVCFVFILQKLHTYLFGELSLCGIIFAYLDPVDFALRKTKVASLIAGLPCKETQTMKHSFGN